MKQKIIALSLAVLVSSCAAQRADCPDTRSKSFLDNTFGLVLDNPQTNEVTKRVVGVLETVCRWLGPLWFVYMFVGWFATREDSYWPWPDDDPIDGSALRRPYLTIGLVWVSLMIFLWLIDSLFLPIRQPAQTQYGSLPVLELAIKYGV